MNTLETRLQEAGIRPISFVKGSTCTSVGQLKRGLAYAARNERWKNPVGTFLGIFIRAFLWFPYEMFYRAESRLSRGFWLFVGWAEKIIFFFSFTSILCCLYFTSGDDVAGWHRIFLCLIFCFLVLLGNWMHCNELKKIAPYWERQVSLAWNEIPYAPANELRQRLIDTRIPREAIVVDSLDRGSSRHAYFMLGVRRPRRQPLYLIGWKKDRDGNREKWFGPFHRESEVSDANA